MGIDRLIDQIMRPVADAVAGFVFFPVPLFGAEMPLIVLWLVAGGLFFTFYLRFINVRGFAQALRIVSGRYASKGDPGEISQFSALATAVSGTVGIGNMAGVAVAISTGGPGATFWLMVAGLLGMSSKFTECTLGVSSTGIVHRGRRHRLRRPDALPPNLGLGQARLRPRWGVRSASSTFSVMVRRLARWAPGTCSRPTKPRPSSSTGHRRLTHTVLRRPGHGTSVSGWASRSLVGAGDRRRPAVASRKSTVSHRARSMCRCCTSRFSLADHRCSTADRVDDADRR